MATVNVPISVSFGSTFANKVGTVGYTVYNADNSTRLARTTTGITERLDGGIATGTYDATQSFDTLWGTVRVVWDFYPSYDGIVAECILDPSSAILGGTPTTAATITLTGLQARRYKDTFNVYKPQPNLTGKLAGKPVRTLIYENIPGYYWATENFDTQFPVGPSKQVGIQTSDRIKFPYSYDVPSGSSIELTTVGHVLVNQFFTVQGDSMRKVHSNARLSFTQVYVVQDAPPVIA
jgi:hypothetical protein